MKTWPIRWGFGGISWSYGHSSFRGFRWSDRSVHPFSIYVALRFGKVDVRPAIGFIVRWLPPKSTRFSGLRIGRLLFVKYR